jgi:hypothetical protein
VLEIPDTAGNHDAVDALRRSIADIVWLQPFESNEGVKARNAENRAIMVSENLVYGDGVFGS